MTRPQPTAAFAPASAAPVMLHVGLPKAGSTTLQQDVFSRLDGVDYHALRRKGGRHAEDGPFGRLVAALREGHGLDLDLDAAAQAMADAADGRPMLVSEERFSDHRGVGVARRPMLLRRLFGPARILIVLRRPVALMTSMRFQENRHPRYGVARAGSVDRWIADALDHAHHHLSPAQMVRYDWIVGAFEEAFGADAVTVAPLELLGRQPEAFAERLAAFLAMPVGAVAAQLAQLGGARNARPRGLAALQAALQAGARDPRRAPREILAALTTGAPGPAVRRRLRDFAAPGIEAVAARHALPLAELGYLDAEG